MNKKTRLWAAVLASVAVGFMPVGLSVFLSRHQALQVTQSKLLEYADHVMQHSERASGQVDAGLDRLENARSGDPCSPAQIALMSEIDLTSTDIQSMGYIASGRLMCSSAGRHGLGLPISAATKTAPGRGDVVLYTQVRLPLAPGMTFIVVERHGYAAIVHEAVTLDIADASSKVSLATYSPPNKAFRSTIGVVAPGWVLHANPEGRITFTSDGYLVALVASKRYSTLSLAALPVSELEVYFWQIAKTLLPIGALAGVAMAVAAFLLIRRQMALPALLRKALKRNALFVLYQPVVDLRTGQCVGAEALVRWRSADGGVVPPDVFIPVAESSGLIEQVTQRVMELVAVDARHVFAQHPDFHIGLNLAAADLQSQQTVHRLKELMQRSGAKSHNIMVEATERGLMDAQQVRSVIEAIHALGIEVAVDDFGTGYSSLSYLQSFALDYLKIDKSFVDTLETGAATSQVALHIIEMAKALALQMIAEGVETQAQADFLRSRGVQYAQGWLFARPMPLAQLLSYVAQRNAAADA